MAKKKRDSQKPSNSMTAISTRADGLTPATPEEEQALKEIFALLLKYSRVDFSHYRYTTVLRRLTRRINLCKQKNYTTYLEYLKINETELKQLYEDLLLSFTHFFRDPNVLDMLKEKIFPQLVKDRSPRTPIRIWVPGCSTGEEVYSLAICIYEFLEKSKSKATVQFFGTDLVGQHIVKAREGLYPDKIRKDVSPERLERFFDKTSTGFKVTKHIREMCVFAVQNITQDPPFPKIDLVSCRNVLIYFDSTLQEIAIPFFHFSLKPAGFLLLGKSETMEKFIQFFSVVDHKVNLYQKRASSPKPVYRFPYHQTFSNLKTTTENITAVTTGKVDSTEITKQVNDILLETYAPPGVLVDSNMLIRQFFGHTYPFLAPTSGEASLKLSRMVGEGLMPDLYLALEEAKKQQKKTRKKNVCFKQDGIVYTIDLCVIPTADPATNEINFIVLFEKSQFTNITGLTKNSPINLEDKELQHLKQELQSTKEYLQSIIEEKDETNQELWIANEEIQSTNEELQSVNEEMEAAKEELESSNEELISLNEELLAKNIELNAAKEFAENLLETANTIIVTLNSEACITSFNRYAEEVTGYKKEEVIGKNWIDIFIPQRSKEEILKVFKTAFKFDREVSQYENPIVIKSGHERLINWNNNILLDNHGNLNVILSIGVDITEKNHAEKALRERESQLREAQRIANFGSWVWNYEKDEIKWSEESYRLFGLEPGSIKPSLKNLKKICHSEDFDSNLEHINNYLKNKEKIILNQRIYWPDGEMRYLIVTVEGRYDNQKNISHLIGAVTDITERKKAEEILQEHVKFLENLGTIDQVIHASTTPHQMLTNVIKTVLQFFKSDRAWLLSPDNSSAPSFKLPAEACCSEYPGDKILDLIIPTLPSIQGDTIHTLNSDGPITFGSGNDKSLPWDNSDESNVQSQMLMTIHPKTGKAWIFGIHQCSHARVWTEYEKKLFNEIGRRIADGLSSLLLVRDLIENEEKYRLMAENITDVIWTMNMDFNFTYISPSIFQLRGYTAEEVMNQSLEDIIPPDSHRKFINLINQKLKLIKAGDQEGWEPISFDLEQYHKNGTIITTHHNTKFLKGPDGEPELIFGVSHDITERKRAEEEKIQAQIIAYEHKKLALVGQIAGKIAHDFNNLLGIIMGNTELAILDCEDKEIKNTLKLIFEQSLRGKNLTKNLVAFAKTQEPKQKFFKIGQKIKLVLNLLKKDLEGVTLTREDGPNIPNLLADPGMIEHALVNLIQNSIHATSLVKAPQIIIRTYYRDNKIYLEIEDNGCGIHETHINKVYEPSFTLKGSKDISTSYKNNIKGTGYGLANVKKYIDQHKGSILIESKIDKGTKFTVNLPVIHKELTKAEKMNFFTTTLHTNKYILLVEDEPILSKIQYRVLTREPDSL